MFKAPTLDLDAKRIATLQYAGTVGATSHLTLVSSAIPYRFRIRQVEMIFTYRARSLVEHYWLVSGNTAVSTTGVPSGENIFRSEAPISYFIGESMVKPVPCSVDVDSINQYIKLHTYNGNAYAYILNCSIVIEEK